MFNKEQVELNLQRTIPPKEVSQTVKPKPLLTQVVRAIEKWLKGEEGGQYIEGVGHD